MAFPPPMPSLTFIVISEVDSPSAAINAGEALKDMSSAGPGLKNTVVSPVTGPRLWAVTVTESLDIKPWE